MAALAGQAVSGLPGRGRLAAGLAAVGVVGLLGAVVSPIAPLTSAPPVTHDEYNLLAPAVSASEGGELELPMTCERPALTAAFGGGGECLTPGFNASFHLGMAAWFRALGAGIRQARGFVLACAAVALGAVLFLGARWMGPSAGALAAMLLLLHGSFWFGTRQVRPESFTLAAYLLAACLLSALGPSRRRTLLALAGLLVGIGIAAHPVGVVSLPILALVLGTGQRPRGREWLWLLAPAVLLSAGYGVFLADHWPLVRANLALNAVHRELRPLSFSERILWEWDRYSLAYWNAYQLGLGRLLERLALVSWAGLAAFSLRRGLQRRQLGPLASQDVVLSAAPPAFAVSLAVLSRDNGNYLYLIYCLPWLFLAGVAGLRRLLAAALDRTGHAGPGRIAAIEWALVAALGVAGGRVYARELHPYRSQPPAPYERVEAIVARHVPRGALLVASETGWLAARRAGAEFVHSRQYLQYLPPYERYPVAARYEGSHLSGYHLDRGLLEGLSRSGRETYLLADTWDWSWNIHAPFGQYSGSYRELEADLDACFDPVLQLYTRDRGMVSLHRYAAGCKPTGAAPALYFEGDRVREEPPVSADPPMEDAEVPLEKLGVPVTAARFPLQVGTRYLLRLELRIVRGDTAVVLWNGQPLPKFVDSRGSVPLDHGFMAESSQGALAFLPTPVPGVVRLESVTLSPLALAADRRTP